MTYVLPAIFAVIFAVLGKLINPAIELIGIIMLASFGLLTGYIIYDRVIKKEKKQSESHKS